MNTPVSTSTKQIAELLPFVVGFVNRFLRISTLAFVTCLFLLCQACDHDDNAKPKQETGTVTDVEGNVYKTVKIGNQWWMAEDLRATIFSNGEAINKIADQEEWATTKLPAYIAYNNSQTSTQRLYNLHVVDSDKKIAPDGWRVPTDEDWKILEEYLGMPVVELDQTNWRGTDQGDQLKMETTNTEGWIRYDGVWGTNTSGFSAAGGSCRVFTGDWGIPPTRHSGFWWTSTKRNGYAWYRYLDYKKSGIFRYTGHPNYGFSIRCVQD